MANFADTAAGLVLAEHWAEAKMADKTWVVSHMAVDENGHTIVRFQRFMSAASPTNGGWVTSRDDAAT